MLIRYRDWELLSDAQEVKCASFGTVKYHFWKKDNGICDVPVRRHVEQLLNPLDGTSVSRYEVAYEKYGIHWNEDGDQIKPSESSTLPQAKSTVTLSEAVVRKQKKPWKEMTMKERMDYVRSSRKVKK